jgi:uncharacterized membrane protein YeaQ/YmgE (transglycosylase-associated protein family)
MIAAFAVVLHRARERSRTRRPPARYLQPAPKSGPSAGKQGVVMSFIIWLIVGGLIGWVASMIMGTNDRQGKILNIVVGIVGAFLGGLLLAPLLGTGTINQGDFSVGSLLVSLAGAVALLFIVGLFRGRRRQI